MTRKTSTYANKRRHTKEYQVAQKSPVAATLINAFRVTNVMRCSRPFNADDGTDANATGSINTVSAAFVRLTDGTSDSTDDFDYLAHAVGVSQVRAIAIAGDDAERNPLLPILDDASKALARVRARYLKWGKWQVDGPGVDQIKQGLEVYESILMASSPRQMADAVEARLGILMRGARGNA